ncbi:unnamed protein product, partial [Laminaria digitata]
MLWSDVARAMPRVVRLKNIWGEFDPRFFGPRLKSTNHGRLRASPSKTRQSVFLSAKPPPPLPYLSVQPQCPGTVFLATKTASSPCRTFMDAASDFAATLIA